MQLESEKLVADMFATQEMRTEFEALWRAGLSRLADMDGKLPDREKAIVQHVAWLAYRLGRKHGN